MGHDVFQIGDLTAVIGDNEGYGEHRAGYNGVHRLTHRSEQTTLFVPTVAGLNLEHVFDGHRELQDIGGGRKVFFEPRTAPMSFKKLSDSEAELHQPPTPTFKVESWTRFKLIAPHYIDFDFRFKPTAAGFRHGYIGLFWASYINAPDDKSMYFRGDPPRAGWQQFCTPAHNNQSTVVHKGNKFELKFTAGTGDALFKNLSVLKYDEPFFYGLFRKHVFIVMFDRSDGIRLTHSPSGGGYNAELQTSNPAWDFQYVVPVDEEKADYVGKTFGFRGRVVYRQQIPRKEVLREYEDWKTSLALLREQHPGWDLA